MKTKSLLSKTLEQFVACIVIVFILTTPLFYLLTKYFYAEDLVEIIHTVESGGGLPPVDLEQDIVEGMIVQFLLLFLVLSFSLFITLRFTTRRLWQPFNDTLRKAEHFDLTQNVLPQFQPTEVREFEHLNRSLHSLMKKDLESFRILKDFTENASHELQTPLAVICGKLDLLMQEDLTERQMELVADLYALTMRMGKLNRNLLLLAKIENAQYATMDDVDLMGLLQEVQKLVGTLQGRATLRVDDSRTDRTATVRANPVLLECLLKNLIVNAIRHSEFSCKRAQSRTCSGYAECSRKCQKKFSCKRAQSLTCSGYAECSRKCQMEYGCEVRIELDDERMRITNPAADVKPLDTQKLFHRFSSGDVSEKGNGLGLAIVKAICDFHHWNVEYSFECGRHNFVVCFKGRR